MESPAVTTALFVLAAFLLLGSTIGGTRAALTYFSENYTSRLETPNIGVTLVENGSPVSWRNYGSSSDGSWEEEKGTLLQGLVPEGEAFLLGRKYPEELAVTNSGDIDEYVRVSIYRYWLDGNGQKTQKLDPEWIDLNRVNGQDWLVDPDASTKERLVLYYKDILGVGETTTPLSDILTVDSSVALQTERSVTEKVGEDGIVYKTITTTYPYNGFRFVLKAEVDAVQTHNAADAIWSAWGCRVNVDGNGSLALAGRSERVE
ncbi:MAG: hypothetical protein HFI93_01505 [Lachnospiraceae bacterium]|nr:hypothetical protein [Lachnospiraceae bacterium]